MKKKIVIVCYFFLPYASSLGSVQRALFLALFLKKKGYDVTVVASKGVFYGYYGYEDLCTGIRIEYVEDVYSKIRNRSEESVLRRTKSNSSGKNRFSSRFTRLVQFLEHELIVPDRTIFSVTAFYIKVASLLSESDGGSVIISSPPHALQIVGLLLKRRLRRKVCIIVDLRDSWNTRLQYIKRFPVSKLLAEHIENKVLKGCDHLVYATPTILKKIRRKYNLSITHKSTLVYNGFVPVKKKRWRLNSSEKIQIGYFGTMNQKYRGVYDLSLLAKVLNRRTDLPLELHFYGSNHLGDADSPNFYLHEVLSHKDTLSKMTSMDYLLIVYTETLSCDEVVTGKLFDYIYAGRPILCYSPYDMDARRIIEKHNLGIWMDCENERRIERILTRLKKGERLRHEGNPIRTFERDIQNAKFLPII